MISLIVVSEKSKGFSISKSSAAIAVATVFTLICLAATILQIDSVMYMSGLVALGAVNYLDNLKKGGTL